MLRLLLKKQLVEIFRAYFYDPKKNTTRSRAATAGMFAMFLLLVVGLLGTMFTFLSLTLCQPLHSLGLDWMYFALLGLMAVLLGTFGSVFNTYAGLYLARDNELLLAMPIPVSAIMAARLLGVYLMGLMYSAVISLPAVVVYWVTVSTSSAVILGGVLLVLLISIFVLTLSCALGHIVAQISLRLKQKSFLTLLVSLAFFAVYYFVCFKASDILKTFLTNAALIGEKVRSTAYPLYLFGQVGAGDFAAMVLVSAVVLGLFALLWWRLARSFLRIATGSGKQPRRVYREQTARLHSPADALLRKELGRFAASPNYMLNCSLGSLLLPLAGIVLLFKGSALRGMIGVELSSPLLCAGVCMIASMNVPAAPSVSLEARTLWLAQSLPVTSWQCLQAKLRLQVLLTLAPALFCLACVAIVFPMSAWELAMAAILVTAFVCFTAELGLTLGLKLPNLTWTSEITPIKQSMAVMLSLFCGFLYAGAMMGCYLWFGGALGPFAYSSCLAALTGLLCFVLLAWLRNRGNRIFASL